MIKGVGRQGVDGGNYYLPQFRPWALSRRAWVLALVLLVLLALPATVLAGRTGMVTAAASASLALVAQASAAAAASMLSSPRGPGPRGSHDVFRGDPVFHLNNSSI